MNVAAIPFPWNLYPEFFHSGSQALAWEPNFQAKLLLCLIPPMGCLAFAKLELGGQVRSQAELGNEGKRNRRQ